jgi:DNA-binding transcriptional ArsR family regulator
MADLLPSSPDVDPPEEPRVVGVDSDDAESLLAALSSETARTILSELHEEPAPPARIAERVDTSIQNAQYHLERLESAGVIEVADTVYSEKGREMKVYAPADRALVVVAGSDDDSDGLRTALTRLLGGFAALGIGSVVVDRLARAGAGPTSIPFFSAGSGGAPAPDGGDGGGSGGDAGGANGAGGAGGDGGAAGGGGETTAATATDEEYTLRSENATVTDGDGGDDQAGVMDTGGTETATETAGTATPSPTPEGATGTPTPTPDPSATPTPTPATTPTPTPTQTPMPTPTPTTTPTPTPTATPTPAPTATSTQTATQTAVEITAADTTTPVEVLASSPGALFFLGGATVLLVWFLLQYARR